MRRRTLLKGLVAASVAGPAAWAQVSSGFPAARAASAAGQGEEGPVPPPPELGRGPLPRSIIPTLLLSSLRLYQLREATATGTIGSHRTLIASDLAAVAALRRAADRALAGGPYSVVHKAAVPPSGDPHDYFSVGPYWWPNPATADGLPYLQRDGEFNPRFRDNTYDFQALDQMTKSVGTLGVAAYVTGDARYAEHAARLIRTWFLDPATRMNPHMRYSQSIPGRPGERGTGILDARQFMAVADAAILLEEARVWSAADAAALRAWFTELLDWLQNSAAGQQEAAAPNNHGSWYAAQVAAFALFTDQGGLAYQVVRQRGPALIASQIEPDGQQPRELARTRPFHYSVFNLEALTALAWLAGNVHVYLTEYQTPGGRSIRGALDYLVPFARGAASWPFPDRDFDAREFAALLARVGDAYPDADYASVVAQVWPDRSPLQQLYQRLNVWWTRG